MTRTGKSDGEASKPTGLHLLRDPRHAEDNVRGGGGTGQSEVDNKVAEEVEADVDFPAVQQFTSTPNSRLCG